MGQSNHFVVADSISRLPLPNASLFDNKGNLLGICNSNGKTPYVSSSNLPLTIRYMGFKEKEIENLNQDTVFLQENYFELPEVVVATRQKSILHMLAYVREYSSLTTYTDTIFLFREKMVDFMVPQDKKMKYRGWTKPRILSSNSYYHFRNSEGLDSVSDECDHHFSWSDWIGVNPQMLLTENLKRTEIGSDTLKGKYSHSEIWNKNKDKITIDINVLADSASRRWVPDIRAYFKDNIDFDNFKVHFGYENVTGEMLMPNDLTNYSFNIESVGRGHSLFRFNRPDEDYFVSTYAEVYFLDKEYISLKEAKKWEKHDFNSDEIEIYEAYEAPELQPHILSLMERVENIDKQQIILSWKDDPRFRYERKRNNNFSLGNRFLNVIKDITGISSLLARKKRNKDWKEFRDKWNEKRNSKKK
ncbi:MAG: hypothetical protein J1F67_12545 [Muribaculaceae bacterium]|nr:hypothetical protein [Muribaculaceae bacterium]